MARNDLDEHRLLHAYVAHGDEDSFRELVERLQALVYHTCLRTVGNRSDAEDLTQECFLTLATRAREVHGNVAAWLHRCAVRRGANLLRDEQRRRARETRWWSRQPTAETPTITVEEEDHATWAELGPLIDRALDELDDADRQLLIERYLRQRTVVSLAHEEGVPHWTMGRRIAGALDELRERLHRHGVRIAPAALLALLANPLQAAVPTSLVATLPEALGRIALVRAALTAKAGAGAAAGLGGPAGWLVAAIVAIAALSGTAALLRAGHARGDAPDAPAPAPPEIAIVTLPGAELRRSVGVNLAGGKRLDREKANRLLLPAIRELGLHHIRLSLPDPGEFDTVQWAADAGLSITLVSDQRVLPDPADLTALLERQSAIVAVQGPPAAGLLGRTHGEPDFWPEIRRYHGRVAVAAAAAARPVAVLPPSVYRDDELRHLAGLAVDRGVIEAFPGPEVEPDGRYWSPRLAAARKAFGPHPVVVSAAGYVQPPLSHLPRPTATAYQAGCLLPRLVAGALRAGAERVFVHALIDGESDRVGLLTRSGAPKPAYRALRELLADDGSPEVDAAVRLSGAADVRCVRIGARWLLWRAVPPPPSADDEPDHRVQVDLAVDDGVAWRLHRPVVDRARTGRGPDVLAIGPEPAILTLIAAGTD